MRILLKSINKAQQYYWKNHQTNLQIVRWRKCRAPNSHSRSLKEQKRPKIIIYVYFAQTSCTVFSLFWIYSFLAIWLRLFRDPWWAAWPDQHSLKQNYKLVLITAQVSDFTFVVRRPGFFPITLVRTQQKEDREQN